ncbi:MAG: lytic murein transglycosylase [Halomonadaceae bacterium]|nr:MAG: lytic murein transglycosylase [Halomonadaceae bacterium]
MASRHRQHRSVFQFSGLLALGLALSPLAQAEFDACVAGLKTQAIEAGVSESLVTDVMTGMEPRERILQLDRSQPEFTASLADYMGRRVNEQRVEQGRKLLAENRELLEGITRKTGVPPHYLVSFWGMETNFGSYFGQVPIPQALTTLACDQRRSGYFTRELIAALQILDRGDITQDTMKGSWAGAMGHMQFMPSVYLAHAVDADGDGRVDLWNSIPDAMTSAGHFLESMGWQRGERWGREVILPEGFDYHEAQGRNDNQPLSYWRDLGVTDAFGNTLPDVDMKAALLLPSGHEGPAFLVYRNFHIIMGWNQSEFYAMSVGHLADRIAGAGDLQNPPPQHPPLPRDTLMALQEKLQGKGIDAGTPDGIMGPATRAGLREFQRKQGFRADGYPGPETLAHFELEPASD